MSPSDPGAQNPQPSTLKPVAFMVMPFRRKPVGRAREGAPREVDCDRLWDLAFRPALEELGYLPVRADVETGSVIVKDMLNRLQHSALVVADVSLPNANVYYELGIRHAAVADNCVMVAADWSTQLFDVEQLRTVRYPLADGDVPEDQAGPIRKVLVDSLPGMATGRSPFHELVEADPGQAFADEAVRISRFQAELSEVRLLGDGDEQRRKAGGLIDAQSAAALAQPEIALELLQLARDVLGWQAMLDLVEDFPDHVRDLPTVREQTLLARSELGDHEAAIAGLEALIDLAGPDPERYGLLGGRYKRLWREERERRIAAGKERPGFRERQLLGQAIQSYERGMQLDLNQYYCSSNLPGLIRARGDEGDEERARGLEHLVAAACQRAETLGTGDEWLYDTLLGAAVRAGDVKTVEGLALKLGRTHWQLKSTLDDARDWLHHAPAEAREHLREILDEMEESFQQKSGRG